MSNFRNFENEPNKLIFKFNTSLDEKNFNKLEKYNLTFNRPRLLTEPLTEEEIDRLIERTLGATWQPIREDHTRISTRPTSAIGEFISSTGLIAAVQFCSPRLTINGEEVIFGGGKHTRIDFIPDGRISRDAKKITESLVAGINGIAELLEAIEGGKVDVAPIFVGRTNIHMAVIAQKLGFTIVDECRAESGEINKDLARFTLVGRLEEIRRRVNEFKQSQAYEQLQERAKRLQVAGRTILDAIFPSARNVRTFPQPLNR